MAAVGKSLPMVRLMLTGREVYRVRAGYRGLRVRSGRAWVTLGGRDVALARGESLSLRSPDDPAVVSTLGTLPVVVELTAAEADATRREAEPAR